MATIDGYIPDAALVHMAKQLGGVDSATPYTEIRVGSGSTANATSTTALASEISTSGFAAVAVTPTTTGAVTSWSTTFTATDAVTVREIGLFTSDDVIGTRGVLGADKTLEATDEYEVTIKIDNSRTA